MVSSHANKLKHLLQLLLPEIMGNPTVRSFSVCLIKHHYNSKNKLPSTAINTVLSPLNPGTVIGMWDALTAVYNKATSTYLLYVLVVLSQMIADYHAQGAGGTAPSTARPAPGPG